MRAATWRSLTTRAEPATGASGEAGWSVSGQKVWTSYAQFARWGIGLVRTDPEAAKHRGISFLVVDMQAPGVEVRPLRQMTGDSEFSEVFLDEVFVPDAHLVGAADQGWAVAGTTLAHERGTNFPFKEQVVHEYLPRRAVVRGGPARPARRPRGGRRPRRRLRRAAPPAAAQLAHALPPRRGLEPGPESSWVKLAWTDMTQRPVGDAALDVLGAEAPLWGRWPRQFLWSYAPSIAGGTSEVQKSIVGERILHLPR